MTEPVRHAIEDVDLSTLPAVLPDPVRRRVVPELAQPPGLERLCASFTLPVTKSTRTSLASAARGGIGSPARCRKRPVPASAR
jgi:hypothetical protein